MGPFDIVLSYGGPESPEEVEPFLDRILAGKPVPVSRRQAVARHYLRLGGISPLNAQVRGFIDTIAPKLKTRDPGAEILQANLFAVPLLDDVLCNIAKKIQSTSDDTREVEVRVFSASAFAGPTCQDRYRQAVESCRERIENEIARQGEKAPRWRFLYSDPFSKNRFFRRAVADTVLEARARALLEEINPMVLFSAHALPEEESRAAGYRDDLLHLCASIARDVGLGEGRAVDDLSKSSPGDWTLVFQSASGSPVRPWTGPKITEVLEKIAASAIKDILVIPVGFVFENMETAYDLDVEIASLCQTLGLTYRRGRTVGTRPEMIALALEFFTS